MATRLSRMVTYLDGLQPVKSLDPLISCSCGIMWQTITFYIFSPTVLMATKHRMVTNPEGLLLIMLLDVLLACGCAWSCDKLKLLCLNYHNVYGHQTWQGCDLPKRSAFQKVTMTLCVLNLARSRDKLKPLDLHYHNAYDHKTWHDGDLPWAASIHKVTWPHNYVVLQDHLTN